MLFRYFVYSVFIWIVVLLQALLPWSVPDAPALPPRTVVSKRIDKLPPVKVYAVINSAGVRETMDYLSVKYVPIKAPKKAGKSPKLKVTGKTDGGRKVKAKATLEIPIGTP